jgi:hypothetical protein
MRVLGKPLPLSARKLVVKVTTHMIGHLWEASAISPTDAVRNSLMLGPMLLQLQEQV